VLSNKVDFIIIGVMKSGTTTIANYLQKHEEIAIPDWEVSFFDKKMERDMIGMKITSINL
jgi:hypothetical protein